MCDALKNRFVNFMNSEVLPAFAPVGAARAERFIKALLNDGSPAETQSEVFYNLGDFKRALEARIKTVSMFARESVAAEWVKVCVEHVEQE